MQILARHDSLTTHHAHFGRAPPFIKTIRNVCRKMGRNRCGHSLRVNAGAKLGQRTGVKVGH